MMVVVCIDSRIAYAILRRMKRERAIDRLNSGHAQFVHGCVTYILLSLTYLLTFHAATYGECYGEMQVWWLDGVVLIKTNFKTLYMLHNNASLLQPTIQTSGMNAVLSLVATGVTNRALRDRPIDTDLWWYWAYRTWTRQTYTYRET